MGVLLSVIPTAVTILLRIKFRLLIDMHCFYRDLKTSRALKSDILPQILNSVYHLMPQILNAWLFDSFCLLIKELLKTS